MIGKLVVILVALAAARLGLGLPLRSSSPVYPQDTSGPSFTLWDSDGGLYFVLPVLALVITAAGILFGCAWCYRHKDCKPNEGTDNQLFATSAAALHDGRRSQPPDSGFSEPANNNISEDNNNGPISLREMQNIANNNAAAYIVSENEERNRVSRESVVDFEPLPAAIRVIDPLERCADWFGEEDFQRNRLQYLREIGRGWFGRVVEGEIEQEAGTSSVAVKILNQNASLEDKARFLDEAKLYRDARHENILRYVAKCTGEDPWIVMFELCSMDLRQYLTTNRPKMVALNDSGVPLQLMCDVASALYYLHSRGCLYGSINSDTVLVRCMGDTVRCVLGCYNTAEGQEELAAPESRRHPSQHTSGSEVWSLGNLLWEVCSWAEPMSSHPPPTPDLPCPYRNHLYQVMQLCWNANPELRPTAAQVHALLNHLHSTARADTPQDDGYGSSDFEERWQRLKPNSIPKIDEHIAIVHAPSTSTHFTGSDKDVLTTQDNLSVDIVAVSRSSSIMSDNPLYQIKSESLNNLHGSLEDVRNIYLTHNEMAVLDCHQGNIGLEEREMDRSDGSVDPWLKDIIAGSQDDVSYYKDVSDVIKNLDNILNSEKTSSSESSHQASPSRDNLSLDYKKEQPLQSCLVKSPGIRNFQNILEMGFDDENQMGDDEDRDTIGTLSHSFERHSDTNSQHTMENLTPDTPIKDLDVASDVKNEYAIVDFVTENNSVAREMVSPKVDCSVRLPNLKDLSVSSVSDNGQYVKDCETSCDNDNLAEIRTEVKSKSVENQNIKQEIKATEPNLVKIEHEEIVEDITEKEKVILPGIVNKIATNLVEKEILEPAIEIVTRSKKQAMKMENSIKEVGVPTFTLMDIASYKTKVAQANDLIESIETTAVSKVLVNDVIEEAIKKVILITKEPDNIEHLVNSNKNLHMENNFEKVRTPVPVQNIMIEKIKTEKADNKTTETNETATILPSEVQEKEQYAVMKENENCNPDNSIRSDNVKVTTQDDCNDSTAYMDLINDTYSEIAKDNTLDDNVKEVIQSCLEKTSTEIDCSLDKNESTVYMDLPSILKETDNFLRSERIVSSCDIEENDKMCTSTPKGSVTSADNTVESSVREHNSELFETKVPEVGPEQTKQEHSLSPFDSPTKSHPTDTYDENSSVVLGPFESNGLEFRNLKSEIDIPKEELLAFSSNFSDINLETPSPLRDGNFLIEVPDIDSQCDDITGQSKPENSNSETENDETDQSGTTKHVSPSTPPNSPGIFLASTSQEKYLVDIDLDPPQGQSYQPIDVDSGLSSLQKEIDLNQIELQITSKLAMAENENNLNIEYSGPLTVEGLVSDEEVILGDSEAVPESFLAGNGGSVEDLRGGFTLDEASMQALRNELELKLPLAQVVSIKPTSDGEDDDWSELPPPPDLVVSYCGTVGFLSPIAEETRHQLSAYENDAWNTSTRTDSSESYPEPCNNSTDEVTDLPPPSHDQSTFTVHSRDSATYTVQRDIPTSREMTMSADSLNGSPYKKPTDETRSPINDRTYTKDDKDTNCERISQVSPFLMSPTTDSAPVESDNATGVSTLSKTTVPTGAKLSKPSELSKATSIDSWCSNDTLYNVEENFDDLAVEAEVPVEIKEGDISGSNDTLHNDQENSNCSTYIIHDSKSDSDSFSPDSITEHDYDNQTYTKEKAVETIATPSVAKSDVDSRNTLTKDLAYGTLPSYSNCTTELVSSLDWKLAQPELVRRSPIGDEVILTPPKIDVMKDTKVDSPQTTEAYVKKMDSVEITCLQDDLTESENETQIPDKINETDEESPNTNYKSMAPSLTSTPLTIPLSDDGNDESIPMQLPEIKKESPEYAINVPNFQTFILSAEIRPQDISSDANTEMISTNQDTILLEGESKTLSRNSKDSSLVAERTPTYSDFESSVVFKPQENSQDRSVIYSQSLESGVSSGDFRNFENSVRQRPQDISSFIDASSLLLQNERLCSEAAMCRVAQPAIQLRHNEQLNVVTNPPITNLNESHNATIIAPFATIVTDLDEDETEQPHSIIITEIPKEISFKNNSNIIFNPGFNKSNNNESRKEETLNDIPKEVNNTYDSHADRSDNHTYDSHVGSGKLDNNSKENSSENLDTKVNGVEENAINGPDFKTELHEHNTLNNKQTNHVQGIINGSLYEEIESDIKCNGNTENFATEHFLSVPFEELTESNVDGDTKDDKNKIEKPTQKDISVSSKVSDNVLEESSKSITLPLEEFKQTEAEEDKPKSGEIDGKEIKINGVLEDRVTAATESFLQNEKRFCQNVNDHSLLNDIRFTGPAAEIMSTSFQDSPTEPESPECEQDNKLDTAAEIMKDWDSDSESHSSNSSSGEFIWKDGAGHETPVVPSTRFDHQRSGNTSNGNNCESHPSEDAASGSADSGSGSEGDEVEFVPSSWDCRAEPAKSSLRSLEQAPPQDSKKRVVFKRQKYHCVYEYPREAVDIHEAAYLPDFSTYCEWDTTSAEEAELGYGQLFGAPSPLDMYPLRGGISFGADYDEDFFISSSARPFESLGIMSTSSQFFPGGIMQKPLLDDVTDDFPPPPSPLVTPILTNIKKTPSLDFTTPDSGVEDITPGSMATDEEYKKLPESDVSCWRPVDSGSSSESVSPSSPGGEALGGLRHTRDKLKLDLPPSPHIPSPRQNRVFNFILDKPKRHRIPDERPSEKATPLVMTDDTPVIRELPLPNDDGEEPPEPTFSTFGKCKKNEEDKQKIVLTDEEQCEVNSESEKESPKVEAVKGEGTVLDSGDEDSGIESSSKATLERETNVS